MPRRWKTDRWCYWKAGDATECASPSDLGFLDEATALAAGHRPCEIRCPAEAEHFTQLWARRMNTEGMSSFAGIDAQLHRQRLDKDLRKRTVRMPISMLPSAAMVLGPAGSYLHLSGRFFLWSTRGYVGEWHCEKGRDC